MGWPVLTEEQAKVLPQALAINQQISDVFRSSITASLTRRMEVAQLHAKRDQLCDAAGVCRECYGAGSMYATDGCDWCAIDG